MMGHRQVEQAALFYEFSLEKHVPSELNFTSRSMKRIASTIGSIYRRRFMPLC